MKLTEAIELAKEAESQAKPIHGYETDKYFVFIMADLSGQILGNNASFVVNKHSREAKWIPQSAFPLTDAGAFFREFDV